jgi:putative PIN family toxin of toxin-antitoxin system
MMRLVLDTSVIVAGMRSPSGASAALIMATYQKKVVLLLSVPLALEYESVCTRLEHYQSAGLTYEQAKVFVEAVIAIATPVHINYRWRPQLKDPDDDMILEVAVNGQADVIVTFNLGDFLSAQSSFGIPAVLPRDVLRRINP